MAMGTAPLVVTTVGIGALGLWADDRQISTKFVVGSGIYALFIAMFGQANEDIASKLALLVFITTLLVNFRPVGIKLGFVKPEGFIGSIGADIGDAIRAGLAAKK